MLRSCKYCGRIHDPRQECPQKKKMSAERYMYRCGTKADRFRRTNAWTAKSLMVRDRDRFMCLCCAAQLDGTVRVVETEGLSVHHIVPLEEDFELRLDETNLITVCSVHHEMCEKKEISREEIQRIIMEQEEKISPL